MDRRRALIALNLFLVGVLALVVVSPPLIAQGGAGRARGQYTLVGGRIQGGNSNAIYIVDATNQEMIAVRWDESRKDIAAIGYRDLGLDAKSTDPGR